MAKIGFSGGEEEKKPGTGTGTGTGAGSSSGNSGYKWAETEQGVRELVADKSGKASSVNWVDNATPYRSSYSVNTTDEQTQTNSGTGGNQNAQTGLAELRDSYAKTLQDKYNYSAQKLKEEKDAALRENWILQQQAEAALPERLVAAGINGGATETSLADLRAQYQGNRNDVQNNYFDSLGELSRQHLTEQAQNAQSYNEKWLDHLLELARLEAAARYSE